MNANIKHLKISLGDDSSQLPVPARPWNAETDLDRKRSLTVYMDFTNQFREDRQNYRAYDEDVIRPVDSAGLERLWTYAESVHITIVIDFDPPDREFFGVVEEVAASFLHVPDWTWILVWDPYDQNVKRASTVVPLENEPTITTRMDEYKTVLDWLYEFTPKYDKGRILFEVPMDAVNELSEYIHSSLPEARRIFAVRGHHAYPRNA